jgi:DNA/RNA-binding domain of Phe-tRNA-synthetase-like protein
VIDVAVDLRPVLMLGVLACESVQARERSAELDAAIAAAEAKARTLPPADTALVRTMYHRLGLDPTRTRPSSEALLRRVKKGDSLPRINTLVDICNWCSLELQVPYGLYDRACVEGPIALRIGREGEEYAGIRKDAVHLSGRMTLADARGPFGNPSADSLRTSITSETSSCLAVIFVPRAHGAAWVLDALDLTASRIVRFAHGKEAGRWVVE